MNRLWRALALVATLAIGFVAGAALSRFAPAPLQINQDAIVPGVDRATVTAIVRRDAGTYIDIQPETGPITTLFIFYPGGLVAPQAYQWLGTALAASGVRTVIPEMPLGLAVVAPNRADALLSALSPLPGRVVLGGHSLGGAMAARYALNHPERLDGLVLMGAYSAQGDDLSTLPLEVLVLAAERDGLATFEDLERGMARLPASAQFQVIRGAVHSFFGRYGPQRGDGTPTTSRAEAEAEMLLALRRYFEPR